MTASVRPSTISTAQPIIQSSNVARAIPADRRISQPKIIGSVMSADILCSIATGAFAVAVQKPALSALWVSGVVILTTAALIIILQQIWAYTIASLASRRQQFVRLAIAHIVTFSAMATMALVAGQDVNALRPLLLSWMVVSLVALTGTRLIIRHFITRWTDQGRLARRAVIVGGGRPVSDLVDSLKHDSGKSIQILGTFDDRDDERSPETVGDYCKLGNFDELVTFCRAHNVDLLIITLPHTAETRILHLLKKLWVLPIDIRISALGSKLKLRPRAYTFIGKTPFLAVFDKPLTDWGQAVKSVEDKVLAGLVLILAAPVMAAVALAVKFTSKGPILFKQTRYGFNNEKIGVYKFRSMYVDQCDANAVKLVTKGDPRVTKVGAFIRKTSLDELPQLFNVLKGELSIVGPRPHAMQAKAAGHIYDEVVEGYFARHKVKPGITGWAQINGWRGETDTIDKIERRVEYDLQYIDNWSVFFDLYILAMTPVSLLNTKNAY